MDQSSIVLACECGKKFEFKDKHRGKELLCPNFNARIKIPGSSHSVAKPAQPTAAPQQAAAGIQWKYLGPGLLMTCAGAIGVLVFFGVLQSGAGGRGLIYLPVFSAVFLLMGLGPMAKALLGDKIEWD